MASNVTTDSGKGTARIVGALFLVAMVASLLGGGLVEAVMSAPDTMVAIAENQTQVIIGALLELVNGLAVVGIGVFMFSILAKYSQQMAVGYLALRIVESVFCCVIIISPLSLITVSQEYLKAGASDVANYLAISTLSFAERAVAAELLIPVFLSLGAMVLYYSLYRSKLLPRFISVWGFVAAVLILVLNLLITFGLEVGIGLGLVFASPMILNEIFLGIWLIIKGFDSSAIASLSEE